MPSEIEICNLALSRINKYPIQSFTDQIKEAKQCKLLYPNSRDAVLRDHTWNFATRRVTLAELSETQEGWDYAYQHPIDCLRLIKIYNSVSQDEIDKISFEIAASSDANSRVILTDEEDAVAIYTARITNPQMYDPLFIDALSYRLAMDLAIPLKGSMQLQQQMAQVYYAMLGKARMTNSNEQAKDPDEGCAFISARA